MLTSLNKDRGEVRQDAIDDDLDFEEAKFTNTLHKSCSRPVTETNAKKGRNQ